jgi:integrase
VPAPPIARRLAAATVGVNDRGLTRGLFASPVGNLQTASPLALDYDAAVPRAQFDLCWLRDDEESALFDALPNWLKPLVTVALKTGMRQGELLNLRWRDVDFTSGTITIRDPKSGEDEHVLMNSTTQQTLKTLWDLSTKVVQLKTGGPDRCSFVFTAPRGGFIQNLKRYWYPALRRAGIDDFHFHDLRHTFASRAAMSGVDLYALQTLMRQRSSL